MDINEILKSESSKLNFLKGLIRVGTCDGEVDENERFFYQQAAAVMGLSESNRIILDKIWESPKNIKLTFENTTEKMFFFIQAIQLCWMDNKYTELERVEIYTIGKELEISRDAIKSVEQWVEEGMAWNARGNELLELE